MSFSPVIAGSGLTAWRYMTRTKEAQTKAFANGPEIQREMDYFRANIGKAKTAEDLVGDRRLLSVALGAFGLESDLNARAFLRKLLSDGTLSADALSNKLADKRYQQFVQAFGYGDFTVAHTQKSDFADKILARYVERKFEGAVGEKNDDLRLALNAQRELSTIASKTGSNATRWYLAMGSPPLRQVLEKAFGLPSGFSSLDIDKQLTTLQGRSAALLGDDDLQCLQDGKSLDKLLNLFLVRSSVESRSSYSAALTLLQGNQASASSLLYYL